MKIRSSLLLLSVLACVGIYVSILLPDVFAGANSDSSILSKQSNLSIYQQLSGGKKLMQDRDYQIPDKPTVYLTFDDGPSKLTPKVLDILKEWGITATFFVCGDQFPGREDTIRRIMMEGHAIGNHSFNHEYQQLYATDFANFWSQVEQTDDRLEEITGVRSTLLRAPGGTGTNFDAFYFYLLDQAGYHIHDWDIDSGDSRRRGVPASEIIANVKKGKLKHELTVLMHDGAGHEETVKALPEIIRYFKDEGYAFASLSPGVQPAQFAISSKLKWSRQMSQHHYERLLDITRTYGHAHNPVNKQDLAERFKVPLTIKLNHGVINLNAEDYHMLDNRFQVPLRTVAEKLNASVQWDESKQKILIQHGVTDLIYDVKTQIVQVNRLGKNVKTTAVPDLQLIESRYFVSLRMLMELLGYTVADYSFQERLNEVSLHPAFDSYQHFPGNVREMSSFAFFLDPL